MQPRPRATRGAPVPVRGQREEASQKACARFLLGPRTRCLLTRSWKMPGRQRTQDKSSLRRPGPREGARREPGGGPRLPALASLPLLGTGPAFQLTREEFCRQAQARGRSRAESSRGHQEAKPSRDPAPVPDVTWEPPTPPPALKQTERLLLRPSHPRGLRGTTSKAPPSPGAQPEPGGSADAKIPRKTWGCGVHFPLRIPPINLRRARTHTSP